MSAQKIKGLVKPLYRKFRDMLSPETHIVLDFLRFHHSLPNLKAPETFNEKIAWRKLFDRNPLLPILADKVRAKEFIAKRFGEAFIIPTLAVYQKAEDLDFNLPPLTKPPYVLKTNHGSGYNFFIKEVPANADVIKAKLKAQLETDYAAIMEEWAYSVIPRRILVEPFIDSVAGLTDFKFHVFQGKVFAVEMVIDRFKGYYINFFDKAWQPLDIQRYAKRPKFQGQVPQPPSFDKMVAFAEELGKEFSYARVDLYEIDNQVKFGECTFYPGGGQDNFYPPDWDKKFGDQWQADWSLRARKE